MLAETNTTAIALLVLGGLLAILSIVALFLRHRSKRSGPEIPITMRPGPSDVALETPVMQRLQGWGMILVVFIVVWFPTQWLLEPGRNLSQEEDLLTLAIARGELAVENFTEENQFGVGCVRCHGPELKGGAIAFRGGYVNPPDLTTVCSRLTIDEISTTLYEGRIDAGMPSWSIRFEGALTDQQINDIINYLVHINEETVPFETNKCTNPKAGTTPEPAATPDAAATPEAA